MNFQVLAIIVSLLMYALAPEAFTSSWAKGIARLVAFFLFVWGLSAIHPLCTILAVSFAFAYVLYYGIKGLA